MISIAKQLWNDAFFYKHEQVFTSYLNGICLSKNPRWKALMQVYKINAFFVSKISFNFFATNLESRRYFHFVLKNQTETIRYLVACLQTSHFVISCPSLYGKHVSE